MGNLGFDNALAPGFAKCRVTMCTTNHNAHDIFLALHIAIVVSFVIVVTLYLLTCRAYPVSTHKEH
jgi:hypothetical protein